MRSLDRNNNDEVLKCVRYNGVKGIQKQIDDMFYSIIFNIFLFGACILIPNVVISQS